MPLALWRAEGTPRSPLPGGKATDPSPHGVTSVYSGGATKHLAACASVTWIPGGEPQDWGWKEITRGQTESKSTKALVYHQQNNHLELAKSIWNQRGLQAIRAVNLD